MARASWAVWIPGPGPASTAGSLFTSMVKSMMQVSVADPGWPRLIVMSGLNSTSPVVTSATATVKVRPVHAAQVPVPKPVQQTNGISEPVHSLLPPPVAVAESANTPGSMFVPTQIEAEESPQEGVCLILLSSTSPMFCGALEVF